MLALYFYSGIRVGQKSTDIPYVLKRFRLDIVVRVDGFAPYLQFIRTFWYLG